MLQTFLLLGFGILISPVVAGPGILVGEEVVQDLGAKQSIQVLVGKGSPSPNPTLAARTARVSRTATGNVQDLHAWLKKHPKAKLSLDRPLDVVANMSEVRRWTHVDRVQGDTVSELLTDPRFTGRGVLIAVIDMGLDLHHEAFRDSLGRTRFLAVWDMVRGEKRIGQTILDTSAGFGSMKGAYHGTHVASVAAGGWRTGIRKGMAPEANLLGVQLDPSVGQAKVIEAIAWVIHLADSLKQPIVINLSIGSHNGPHDGNSEVDLYLDSVVSAKAGRVVVGAVGNEGSRQLHGRAVLAANDTTGSFAQAFTRSETDGLNRVTAIDLWGKRGEAFAVQWMVWDTVTTKYVRGQTWFHSKDLNLSGTAKVRGPGGENVGIRWTSDPTETIGDRPHIYLELRTSLNTNLLMGFRMVGNGTVDFWNVRGDVTQGLRAMGWPGFISGDDSMCMSEVGGTGRKTISVGAFGSRNTFTDIAGDVWGVGIAAGEIAPFSSRGPTIDLRQKPDVVAPGTLVEAALSSLEQFPEVAKSIVARSSDSPTGKRYQDRYITSSGTSMAAPVVTGAIALLLQADPTLTIDQIRSRVLSTLDTLPAMRLDPTAQWGYGALNAEALLATTVTTVQPEPVVALPTKSVSSNWVVQGRIFRAPEGVLPHQVWVSNARGQRSELVPAGKGTWKMQGTHTGVWWLHTDLGDRQAVLLMP